MAHNGWPEERVSNLQGGGILLVEDGNHGEYRPRQDEFVREGTAFVRAADMDNGRILFGEASKINASALERIRKGIGAPGDVLLSHKGTVGKVAAVPLDAPPFVCSPQTTFWRCLDENQLDRRFLYYYLLSAPFREQLDSLKGETDMADYVSLTAQRQLRVSVPPISNQRRIGNALGALDDKIDVNQRMNETLEMMARAFFKSWFVDFEPVHTKETGQRTGATTAALFPGHFENSVLGRIPAGWRTGFLLEANELLSGGTPKTSEPSYWNGDIPWASAKDVSQSGECFLVQTERSITKAGLENSSTQMIDAFVTVVVARGATTGRMVMFGSPMAMNQTCYALRSKAGHHFFTYCQAKDVIDRLVHAGHGSVFNTITTTTFQSTDVVLPDEAIAKAFDSLVQPFFRAILKNQSQSLTLARVRDALLPKLLSGDVRARSAEKAVEAAI